MKNISVLLIFLVILMWRWTSLDSPLPKSWTPESKIRYTATVYTRPEYTDSKTIIKQGRWEIQLKGYAVIIPGSRVAFVGKATPKVLMGKTMKIVMKDPTFELVPQFRSEGFPCSGIILIKLGQLREKWVGILEKTLPSPMSSLAAGILLGVKGQMSYDFYQLLVKTGTLHVVAASGFNVMMVASTLMTLVKRFLRRGVAIGVGVMGILFYVLLAGAGASVVRAGVMGSLTLIAYYFGRPAEAKRLLWVSAGLMLLFNPLYIVDVGFQLSVAATAGLLYIEPHIGRGRSGFLAEYLYPTLAATLATLPIILFHFGRVSWISPLVNMLILPLIPLIMLLSAILIAVGSVNQALGQTVAWFLYPALAWVVGVIRLLG